MNHDTQRPKILIVDDERFNLNLLHALLREDYRTMVATNGEQAFKAASSGAPDLILLDVNMPGIDGFEVCRRLKEEPATRNVPVIFITAMHDAADETQGFDLGAVDYITKPFHSAVVKARVRTHLRLKQQSDLLERYAFLDALTGLANRRAFDDKITEEWNRCRRSSSPLSVLLIDVDHFKGYNDHYGHGAGDLCLSNVARALSGCLQRAGELLARYGGEEFVAVLPDSDAGSAAVVAERLRAAVDALKLPHQASAAGDHVTVSLGVATTTPSDASSHADLLAAADGALYQAKAAGRNRWHARTLTG